MFESRMLKLAAHSVTRCQTVTTARNKALKMKTIIGKYSAVSEVSLRRFQRYSAQILPGLQVAFYDVNREISL